MVSERVEVIRLVKAFGAEQRTLAAFDVLADRSALAVVAFVALHWLQLPVAATLVLVFLLWPLLRRLMDVQQSLRDAVPELPGYETVRRVLARRLAAREASFRARAACAGKPFILPDVLRFEYLVFAYRGAAAVLQGVDVPIPPVRSTAVTRPSGSATTTLANLVLGLHHPMGGRILLDSAAHTHANLDDWRHAIAYLPQETLLLHDSVAANLRWARPDTTIDEIAYALR